MVAWFFVDNPHKNKKVDIQKILNLIGDPDKWTKRALARDKDDEQIFDPWSEDACKWCILGAAYKAEVSQDTVIYLETLVRNMKYGSLDKFNDLNKHESVIKFLNLALSNL